MNVLLMDTETTGLKPKKSFILSNGAILYNTETGETKEFYQVLNWKMIMSNFYIPEDTIEIHGITENDMIRDGVHPLNSMSEFYQWIKSFVGDGQLDVCVAFNLAFDLNMFISNLKYLLDVYCKSFNPSPDLIMDVSQLLDLFTKKEEEPPVFIDSMIMDQIFHFEHDGEKVYHNLDAVGLRYGIESDPNAHNAIADTRRTLAIFKIQMKELLDMGIKMDQKFENRMIKKYNRNQNYWKKSDGLEYLGTNMTAANL